MGNKKVVYICNRLIKERARSSVGSEHLVYTQGVRGSNPFAPTSSKNPIVKTVGFFIVGAPENEVFNGAETIKKQVEYQLEGFYLQKWILRDHRKIIQPAPENEVFNGAETIKNQVEYQLEGFYLQKWILRDHRKIIQPAPENEVFNGAETIKKQVEYQLEGFYLQKWILRDHRKIIQPAPENEVEFSSEKIH